MSPRRVVLVTGAGRGIGRAHALTLAARGWAVVVNDVGSSIEGSGRDQTVAESVAEEINVAGGIAIADTTDVASVAGGRAAVVAAIDAFGRVDAVVNNAGFAHGGGDVEHPEEEELLALIAVHYLAAVGTMSAAFADMRKRSWGRIINTVSEVALDTRLPGSLGYGGAKAALWSATLSAARQGAAHGITVNAISPGARTRMNADLLDAGLLGGRAGADLDPQHVAHVVAYLISDAAADITGRIVHAAGGAIREYTTVRTAHSDLVERLSAEVH